jgi:hypothetical protein
VTRLAFRLGRLAAAAGVVVGALFLFTSLPREPLVDGYVLFVGGLVLLWLVAATRAAGGPGGPSLYDRALRRGERPRARPSELEALERAVGLSSSSSFDLHFRLRPALREVAAHRLSSRRGLDLDSGSADVRAAVGDELWELVRPERPAPADRGFGPGVSPARLRGLLERLERI